MRRSLHELFLYGLVSIVALGADAGLLLVLTHFTPVPYLLAATGSFISGAFVAYALSVRYVFTQRRIPHRGAELLAFCLLGLAGLVVNDLVIAALVEWAHSGILLAKMGAAGCTFLVNFLLRRQLLFRVPTASSSECPECIE